MFNNRFLAVLGFVSLLLVNMAVSQPRSNTSQTASDFHQRHPDWTWTINHKNTVIPVTGDSTFPDYYQRHPELSVPTVLGLTASDYFIRHSELVIPAEVAIDMTDYYFRQTVLLSSSKMLDLTDYFFRHRDARQ